MGAAPHLESKLRQTQLLGMLMERALHDPEADWRLRLGTQTHPLRVKANTDEVEFSAEFASPGNYSGDTTFVVLLDGVEVYVITRPIHALTGDQVTFRWKVSPYRLTLA